ncbi:hypothetical protein K438DRAFT_1928095 [Mycena galopus ATCC 62051]|nr:hypothetical protein K438DRAFT_1928095 [Mycena galopus ATCC 62051]
MLFSVPPVRVQSARREVSLWSNVIEWYGVVIGNGECFIRLRFGSGRWYSCGWGALEEGTRAYGVHRAVAPTNNCVPAPESLVGTCSHCRPSLCLTALFGRAAATYPPATSSEMWDTHATPSESGRRRAFVRLRGNFCAMVRLDAVLYQSHIGVCEGYVPVLDISTYVVVHASISSSKACNNGHITAPNPS